MENKEQPHFEEDDASSDLYERIHLKVDPGQEPIRIDKFLTARIVKASRNKVQQAANEGHVLVNQNPVKSNYKIKPGDEIVVYTTFAPPDTRVIPEEIPLDIEYEDDALLVVYKPAGLVVHPGHGNYAGTLLNGLAWYLGYRSAEGVDPSLSRFGLVHRLDKDTSGLLVVGKTQEALSHLAGQFFDHTVERIYQALAWGEFEEPQGTIDVPIGRHPRHRIKMTAFPKEESGKRAITHYKVLESFHYVSLLECQLETGRTHQIRVHMQYLHHPLFNDPTYGGDRIVKGTVFAKYKQFVQNSFDLLPRQALHAYSLKFIHPVTGQEMFFKRDLPEDMKAVIERWRKYTGAN